MDNNELDKELGKLVDAVIEDAISKKHEKYNFEEETGNSDILLYKPWIYRMEKI